jgi:hypothetical protein
MILNETGADYVEWIPVERLGGSVAADLKAFTGANDLNVSQSRVAIYGYHPRHEIQRQLLPIDQEGSESQGGTRRNVGEAYVDALSTSEVAR